MIFKGADGPLKILLFGTMEIHIEGRPLPLLRSRKGLWLLALLVLRRNREVSRDWLAVTLWPDSSETLMRSNLRRTLTDLRQALGSASLRLVAPTPQTLLLRLTDGETDLAAFDTAIRQGDAAALETALAVYRGPLLESCTEEWIVAERTEREQQYLNALETLADHALMRGNASHAIVLLRRVVAGDALRETAWRALMTAQAQEGGFAAVTQTYRDLRLLLRREVNADPAPETTALFARLQADTRKEPSRPQARPGSKAAVRPSSSNLPHPLTSLIGRRSEIGTIGRLLESERLLTLTGTGGIGKTRLALQSAEERATDFPDGVRFVDLAPLMESALVPQAVAMAVGIREKAGRPLMETLLDFLRERHLLLILDNCEHLREACGELAATLLRECPLLSLLVTSRQALGIPSEVVWTVPALSLPALLPASAPGTERLSVLNASEAIQLFVERAAAIMPFFALTERNAMAAARICRCLDGIPLAIELAAARAKVLTAEQIAARLEDRFRLLTHGEDVLPRQQTLQASLAWSYDLLSVPESALLRSLSVFAGGWTLEAAEAVCAGEDASCQNPSVGIHRDEVLDLLDALIAHSLVVVDAGDGAERRYRLLETVREYALLRRRQAGDVETIAARHFAYYLELTTQAERGAGGPELADWMERLENEKDNLRAGLSWALEAESRTEGGLWMAGRLWFFWHHREYAGEGKEWVRQLLARCGPPPTAAQSKALNTAGVLTWSLGEYAAAQRYLQEALAQREHLNDTLGVASTLNNLGLLNMDRADYAEAQGFLERSLTLWKAYGDTGNTSATLNNLGVLAWSQGEAAAAQRFYTEALELHREQGNLFGMALSLSNLGLLAVERRDLETARVFLTESLAKYRSTGMKVGISQTLFLFGEIACQEGDYAAARTLYAESATLRTEMKNSTGLVECIEGCATVAFCEGQREKALTLWAASEAHREALHWPLLPRKRETIRARIEAARTPLTTKQTALLWETGRAMTLEQAVAFALETP